jgi:hypothetical protein
MNRDFSFRVHLVRARITELNIDANTFEFIDPTNNKIVSLSSANLGESIKKSRDFILKASGWNSESEAADAAEKYTDLLRICFAKLRLGVDYGRNRPKSMFTKYGLEWLSKQSGHERILNDVYGTMIYETNPPPRFVTMHLQAVIGKPEDQLSKAIEKALKYEIRLSVTERLSIDLFNASYFQESEYTRFMLLVMAIEALLKRENRTDKTLEHIDILIKMTRENDNISSSEKESLIGGLTGLKNESINQMGRKLAKERLGSKTYNDKSPEAFFSYCYYLRSRLVHGGAGDSVIEDIRSAVATLEVFVSDLLSGPLRD